MEVEHWWGACFSLIQEKGCFIGRLPVFFFSFRKLTEETDGLAIQNRIRASEFLDIVIFNNEPIIKYFQQGI